MSMKEANGTKIRALVYDDWQKMNWTGLSKPKHQCSLMVFNTVACQQLPGV